MKTAFMLHGRSIRSHTLVKSSTQRATASKEGMPISHQPREIQTQRAHGDLEDRAPTADPHSRASLKGGEKATSFMRIQDLTETSEKLLALAA